jgi:hypothetical protein
MGPLGGERGVQRASLRVLLWGSPGDRARVGLGATARGTALLARALSLRELAVIAHREGNLLEAGFERIAWRDAAVVELRDIA